MGGNGRQRGEDAVADRTLCQKGELEAMHIYMLLGAALCLGVAAVKLGLLWFYRKKCKAAGAPSPRVLRTAP